MIVHRIVIDIQGSLLYAEKKLRLIRVIDHLRRPAGLSMLIVIKGTGVNMGEIIRNRRPFCDLPQTGRNDVMLHKDAPLFPIGIDPAEPSSNAVVQPDFTAVLFQPFLTQYFLPSGALKHSIHVRQILIHAVYFRQPVRFRLKAVYIIVHGTDIPVLHIFRGKRPIKIIADRQYRPVLYFSARCFHDVHFLPTRIF